MSLAKVFEEVLSKHVYFTPGHYHLRSASKKHVFSIPQDRHFISWDSGGGKFPKMGFFMRFASQAAVQPGNIPPETSRIVLVVFFAADELAWFFGF